ncbi:MAG: hypothetical protein ACRDRU_16775 [Pseudonocardiaceae bacterium]
MVPLARVTLDAVAAHLAAFPATEITIEDRTDPRTPVTRAARLLFTMPDGQPVTRHRWSAVWMPAARTAGLAPRTGLHALRHVYASLLKVSGVALGASFGKIRELLLTATSTFRLDHDQVVEASSHVP